MSRYRVLVGLLLFGFATTPAVAQNRQPSRFGLQFNQIDFQPVSFSGFQFRPQSFQPAFSQPIQFRAISFPSINAPLYPSRPAFRYGEAESLNQTVIGGVNTRRTGAPRELPGSSSSRLAHIRHRSGQSDDRSRRTATRAPSRPHRDALRLGLRRPFSASGIAISLPENPETVGSDSGRRKRVADPFPKSLSRAGIAVSRGPFPTAGLPVNSRRGYGEKQTSGRTVARLQVGAFR